MKIAVPTRGSRIDDHFGHCEVYTVVTVNEQNEITATEILPSPQGCGCKSDIASILRNQGVTVMLAGNMGAGALNVLSGHGINVYRGCAGNVNEVVNAFLAGNIEDSGKGCETHEHHHGEHGHSHGEHSCHHH